MTSNTFTHALDRRCSTSRVRAGVLVRIAGITVALALAACGGDGDDGGGTAPGASTAPAVAAFRDAFESQRYDLLPGLVADLEAAAASAPHDAEIALTLALSNLWGAAEIGRVGGDVGREAAHAVAALRQLEHARTLAPDDARIIGFIGAVRTRLGLETGNADLVERGLAEIESGIAVHPEFNAFVKILVLSRLERDDPRFAQAFDAFARTMDACGLPVSAATPTLDRDAFARQPSGLTGPDRVCWNGPRALHNFEATWLITGDLYLKASRPDVARALYANAATFASYASWSFRALVEQRIAEADALAARFADGDPGNDPEIVADSAVQCAVCHAR